MNPERGGRPPRERRVRGAIVEIAGAFVQEVASALIVMLLLSLRVKNTEDVMIIYRRRARRVRWGVNFRIKIIQPR